MLRDVRAETGLSLQEQGDSLAPVRADIQVTKSPNFSLQCGRRLRALTDLSYASQPGHTMPDAVAMIPPK